MKRRGRYRVCAMLRERAANAMSEPMTMWTSCRNVCTGTAFHQSKNTFWRNTQKKDINIIISFLKEGAPWWCIITWRRVWAAIELRVVNVMEQMEQLNLFNPECEFLWNCSACFVLTPLPHKSQTFNLKSNYNYYLINGLNSIQNSKLQKASNPNE